VSNELIINSTPKGDRIALLQDKRIVEYHIEQSEPQFSVGDIYLGTIKKLVSGLNAAFIDIGYEKDAFLHYHDLGPNLHTLQKFTRDVLTKKGKTIKLENYKLESEIDKLGKIDKVLTRGQLALVQVVKEPISTKGPRLSCDISIAGRFLVLVPFSNGVNISKKITSKVERNRLQKLMTSIKPKNYGVIVRTVAEGKAVEEMERDLKESIAKWEDGIKKLVDAKPTERIIGEMSRATSMLRDLLNNDFDNVIVDSQDLYNEAKDYVHNVAPEKEKIVKLHTGKTKLFEQVGIEKQLKMLFGRSVSLPGGGYLIVEHTEALHVIDVNSGNKSNSEEDQEATALSVNREAAKEIARQLRLRDMGGIIVIDFIDMKKAENRKLIQDIMRDEMRGDRSKYTILPLTKFGLMQITRQRVRPEMNVSTHETCPSCGGTGTITASIAVSEIVAQHVEHLVLKQNERKLTLLVHPFLHAYFTKGLPSIRMNWFFKYKTWISIMEDSSFGITEFKFLNQNGDAIEISS
jgi:ribonuclease G